jgi:hypothetical protein
MHPTYPTKCAYVEPKSGRVYAPAGKKIISTMSFCVMAMKLSVRCGCLCAAAARLAASSGATPLV